MKNLISVRGFTPEIGTDVYIADNARVIGDVKIGSRASIWYNVTIRGDVMPIRIGDETNVQDGTVIHGTFERCGTTLGKRVTIGHNVTLHGCEVLDATLVGMGSTLMDKSRIGKHCIVGAGSLVTENSVFEDGSLILGRPAKFIRKLTDKEVALLEQSADNYLQYKSWYESP
jgi:carbonic anhydrase/acetyltransferase-like protein (isoleucine patch superfamily)